MWYDNFKEVNKTEFEEYIKKNKLIIRNTVTIADPPSMLFWDKEYYDMSFGKKAKAGIYMDYDPNALNFNEDKYRYFVK